VGTVLYSSKHFGSALILFLACDLDGPLCSGAAVAGGG